MPTLPTRRRYKFANAPVVTTLAADMAAGATTFTLTSGTNWPGAGTGNFWVTIGAGTATEERILCSSTTGTTVTVASSGRGQDGTSAVAHSTGDSVWVSWSATDADDANAHVSATGSDATVSIHGLDSGSNVVGTTDTQTLTNKTLTGPRISGTSSGTTLIQGASAASGTITIPAATDTLVGRATTDTLTNKTLTSPVINSGALTSPAITSGATFNGSSSGTTVVQAAATASGTLTLPAATDTLVGKTTTDTLTNKTLTSPVVGGGATFNGSSSGTTVVQAAATASGTLTLPAATDTLVGRATSDTLTNKTINGGTVNPANLQVNGTTLVSNTSGDILAGSSNSTVSNSGGWGTNTISVYSMKIGRLVFVTMSYTVPSARGTTNTDSFTFDLTHAPQANTRIFLKGQYRSAAGPSLVDISAASTGSLGTSTMTCYISRAAAGGGTVGSPLTPANFNTYFGSQATTNDTITITGVYESAS